MFQGYLGVLLEIPLHPGQPTIVMVDSSFTPAGVEHFGALCAKLRSCQGKVQRVNKSLKMTIL